MFANFKSFKRKNTLFFSFFFFLNMQVSSESLWNEIFTNMKMFPACVASAYLSLHSLPQSYFKVSFEHWQQPCCVNHTAAWAKNCQKMEYFITKRTIYDSRYLMCSREKKKQRTSTFWGKKKRPCEAGVKGAEGLNIKSIVLFFIIYVQTGFHHAWRELAQREALETITAADWLLKRSSGRLRLPFALWTDAKLRFNFHPTTGNLACSLITSQTPTQCLASGNTKVKSATEVSQICHKCWRRHQQFKGESSACLRATSCCRGQELIPKKFCVTSAGTFWCFVLSCDGAWGVRSTNCCVLDCNIWIAGGTKGASV